MERRFWLGWKGSSRENIVEKFYGRRGPAPKELLDEFMLEAEAQ